MDRRSVIKAGVGAGAAAAVWGEPTIRGFARRPAYAAVGTGSTVVAVPNISGLRFGNGAGGGLPKVMFSDAATGLTVTMIGPLTDGSHANGQVTTTDTYTLRAEIDGCVCSWTDASATNIFRRNGNGVVANGASNPADPGEILYVFDGVAAGGIANDFNITNPLEVTCV